jgi:Tol biopolymer transport system component
MRRRRSFLLSLGLAATVATLAIAPALATFPGGTNGRIAMGVRANGAANIWTMRPDGTGLRQLTTGTGFTLCPAYSADGHSIAYCSNASGAFEIWTMRQDGSKQRQLTHLGGFATFPDYSPDGSRIAFGGSEGTDPNSEIYVVNGHTGRGLRALTSCAGYAPGCVNELPAWSPDGTKILFNHADDSNADGDPLNEQVWVMDANGAHKHQLTSDALGKGQVADWSPDGSKIAYNAGTPGSGGTWVMNADGSNQHQLSGCVVGVDPQPCATGDEFGVAWSPDGTKIAFLNDLFSIGINDRPVFVMNADGSNQHRITTVPIVPGVPAWQPLHVDED